MRCDFSFLRQKCSDFRYDRAGTHWALARAGLWRRSQRELPVLTDHLGSIREVVDDTGTVIQSYEFNEHGIPMPGSGTASGTFSPKTYQGALSVNDDRNDSGLYLMGHRHYAADLGRFISRDPIGFRGGLNLFNGAGNSPVSGVDPAGLHPWQVQHPDTGQMVDVPHGHPPENTQAWKDGDFAARSILRDGSKYREVPGPYIRPGEFTSVQWDPSIGIGFTATSNCFGFAAIGSGLTGADPTKPDNSETRGFYLEYAGLELLVNIGLKNGTVKQVDTPQAGDLAIYDLSGKAFDKASNRLRSSYENCPHAAIVESVSPLIDRSKYGTAGPVMLTGGKGAFGGTPIYFRIGK